MAKAYNSLERLKANPEKQTNTLASIHTTSRRPGQVQIPPNILGQIWKENLFFCQDKHVFSDGFFKFIWNLIHLYPPTGQDVEGMVIFSLTLSVKINRI